MEEQDIFMKIIQEGILKESGLTADLEPYRIIIFRGKEVKLILNN